jgi:hypothetical protein
MYLWQDVQQWLFHALPNIKHLTSSFDRLLSEESDLIAIMNERIERLKITLMKLSDDISDIVFINAPDVEIKFVSSNE